MATPNVFVKHSVVLFVRYSMVLFVKYSAVLFVKYSEVLSVKCSAQYWADPQQSICSFFHSLVHSTNLC